MRAGAAALPSGRNIHSIDPWRLPSDAALARGMQMAEQMLAQHRLSSKGAYPQTVALTLWALDTIKTEGESIGAALALVGARPERDGQGKIWRYELVPLEKLGRPRIDVLLDVSAIFRDTFQISLDLLDDLFRRAAEADEPLGQNFIRAHALEQRARGLTWEQATARIFTQRPADTAQASMNWSKRDSGGKRTTWQTCISGAMGSPMAAGAAGRKRSKRCVACSAPSNMCSRQLTVSSTG